MRGIYSSATRATRERTIRSMRRKILPLMEFLPGLLSFIILGRWAYVALKTNAPHAVTYIGCFIFIGLFLTFIPPIRQMKGFIEDEKQRCMVWTTLGMLVIPQCIAVYAVFQDDLSVVWLVIATLFIPVNLLIRGYHYLQKER